MILLGFIFIAIIFCWLFSSVFSWHISIIEELEIKENKENLCETVYTVLTCYIICNMISFLFGILLFFSFDTGIDIDSGTIITVISLIFSVFFPLLALIAYIWMIVKEVRQIKKGHINFKYIISLVLITLIGFITSGIGFLLCMIECLKSSGFHG